MRLLVTGGAGFIGSHVAAGRNGYGAWRKNGDRCGVVVGPFVNQILGGEVRRNLPAASADA